MNEILKVAIISMIFNGIESLQTSRFLIYVWLIHYIMLLEPASFSHLDRKELKGQPWMKINKNMMSKTK